MKEKLRALFQEALQELSLPEGEFVVEYPADSSHGDYATNVAMVIAKKVGKKPSEVSQSIVDHIKARYVEEIDSLAVAGPGFINITLSREFFTQTLQDIQKKGTGFGKTEIFRGQKIIVEYTDPNPFKEFHIGHLMSNAIGESISRIVEWNGAEVKRACYQGDTGIHIAKAVWGKMDNKELSWAEAYTHGSRSYEEHAEAIARINKIIHDKSDPRIVQMYEEGKRESLEYFETIYKKLGTKFDFYFFESETGVFGKEVVEQNLNSVFIKSDGAIVFKGEEHDKTLHTRVFINKEGLPTYEAKELGLAKIKYDMYPYDTSIVITGNEINDYFRVLLKAMSLVFPDLEQKTKHLSHGMLRLPTGKMSSRTGDVITAESLIEEVKRKIEERVAMQGKEEGAGEGKDSVAVSAIKYSILKQSIGKDIIFDIDTSISLEGDSGPYLQYALVRAKSVLKKAKQVGIVPDIKVPTVLLPLERVLYRFPEVVERAGREYAPQYLVTYLTEVASLFNSFYAEYVIADPDDREAPYKALIADATRTVLENGLSILGIRTVERM